MGRRRPWPDEHLPDVAPRIRVPVHNELAEFDALWDSTPAESRAVRQDADRRPFVDASIARATGHSIDHHILGHALHLRQLAFAGECELWTAERGELMPPDAPGATAELPASAQVIVAGGGPVGLAAAIEMGRRGVRCLVIEPRTTVSHARPRCKTINVRSNGASAPVGNR